MPKRWLDPTFFTDEKLAKATIPERQLFAALIANQDDDGRLQGHPGYLRSMAFPYDDFSLEQVREMRDHLAEVNPNVVVYQNSENEYIQLRRYKRYQNPRYYHASKLPAPPDWPFEDEPLKNDYKGDVEKTIQYEIAGKLKGGEWQPTNEAITDVQLNKRLGNLYVDIFATTTSQTYFVIEIKQYPLQFRDLGQIMDYRTEAELRGLRPIKAFLVGNGLGNLDPEEALSSSVILLNLDLSEINPVAPTSDPVTPPPKNVAPTTKAVNPTTVTEQHPRVGLGRDGVGQDLGKREIPPVSLAAPAAPDIKKPQRQKLKQAETGSFLDMVEQHIGTKLVQRPKLMSQIRPLLVKFPEATPESLLDCFKWLKQHDPYCQARDSPMVISMLPSKYPEWAAGKLQAGGHRKLPTADELKRGTKKFMAGEK